MNNMHPYRYVFLDLDDTLWDFHANARLSLQKMYEQQALNRYFENFEDLLNEIEMLDIVTPTLYHYDYAMKAIDKRIHFFIEKPVTQTLKVTPCGKEPVKYEVSIVLDHKQENNSVA